MTFLAEPLESLNGKEDSGHDLSELVDRYIASETEGSPVKARLMETYKNICDSIEHLESLKNQGGVLYHKDAPEHKDLLKLYWEIWDKLREHPFFP